MAVKTDVVGSQASSTNILVRRIIAYTVLVILVILSLFPFYLLLMNATREKKQTGLQLYPGGLLWNNFKKLFNSTTTVSFGSVFKALRNSLLISACASILSVYVSALTAYAIHVFDFKLRKVADMFILIVMMVPTQSSAIGFYRMVKAWGLTDSKSILINYIPLIIPAAAAPATYYFMKQYLKSALPLEIVEASRIDGCGEFMTFNRIVTPILKPAYAVQLIFTFVANWNNYFMPRLVITSKANYTVPLVLSAMRNAGPQETDMGLFYMYILIAILPVVIVYLILSKFIIRGVALGSVKG
ncbi:MAG: carbohydrate ABC transporter permease [Ruminococcus sp.]|nr:carbohydrate ABC transporter permease [Ruminococcus sp.]